MFKRAYYSDLSLFLQKKAKRSLKRKFLERVLIEGDEAYLRFRLQLFSFTSFANLFLRLFEAFFLLHFFSTEFRIALALRLFCSLLLHFYWGGLEILRENVRTLWLSKAPNNKILVVKEISQWLSGAIFLSSLLIAAYLVYLLMRRTWTLFDAYMGVMLIRLCSLMFLRTYQSAVHAIKRIQSPLFSLMSVYFAGAAGIFLFDSSPNQRWFFLLISSITIILHLIFSFYFTFKEYLFLGLSNLHLSFRPWNVSIKFFQAGLSFMFAHFDIVLLFLLTIDPFITKDVSTLMFIAAPLFQGCQNWARLFYLDLKKIQSSLFMMLKKFFLGKLLKYAFFIGLISCSLFFLSTLLPLGEIENDFIINVMVFLLLRPFLSLGQMLFFVNHRFHELILSKLLIISMVAMIFSFSTSLGTKFLSLSGGLVANLAFFCYIEKKKKRENIPHYQVTISFSRPLKHAEEAALKRRIGIEPEKMICLGGEMRWYEDRIPLISLQDLLLFTKGAVRKYERVPFEIAQKISEDPIRKFQEFFARDPYFYAIIDLKKPKATNMMPRELYRIFWSAVRFARGQPNQKGVPYDVTAYCEDGALHTIFVLDQQHCKKRRGEWREWLRNTQMTTTN